MITSITIDLNYTQHPYSANFYKTPVIIIQRGGYWHGTTTIYKATGTALQWAARYIARNSGAVKVNNENSATWYHNVDPMYTDGYVYSDEGFITLEVLPSWNLKITLSEQGKEIALERLEGLEKNSGKWNREIMNLELDLFEYALCNGWTCYDGDAIGSWFITMDGSIDDYGDFDVNPGDLGWSYDDYMIYFVGERLIEKGFVIFTPYYFGETSLDDQRSI